MGIQQAHPVDALISVIFTGNVQCCGHGEERRRDDDFGGYAAAVAEVPCPAHKGGYHTRKDNGKESEGWFAIMLSTECFRRWPVSHA